MPSNAFLNPNGTTTITITSDLIEGMSRYGRPFQAYRCRTAAGTADMYFPSPRILEQLDGRRIGPGTELEIQGSPATTRDGRSYTRYELLAARVAEPATRPSRAHDDGNLQMLRCVALKAAAATRGISGEPPEVISAANAYLDWLTRP